MPLKTVDAATLKRWLDSGEAVLVDVREPAEHAAESIAEAKPIPLASLSKAALPACAGKKLVLHCQKGARGGAACQKLLADDPDMELYNLSGGIEAWRQAGLTVETSGSFFLPLDRQVQLTVGLFVLIGSALAYFAHPLFMLLPAFIGAGLVFAGLSGTCGLALLLARMPWNRNAKAGCCAA